MQKNYSVKSGTILWSRVLLPILLFRGQENVITAFSFNFFMPYFHNWWSCVIARAYRFKNYGTIFWGKPLYLDCNFICNTNISCSWLSIWWLVDNKVQKRRSRVTISCNTNYKYFLYFYIMSFVPSNFT